MNAIISQQQDFSQYLNIVTPNNQNIVIPSNILHDINLLYSYKYLDDLSEEDFYSTGINAIDNMIYNVVHTVIGSREFEPEFGSRCLVLIQEPCVATNIQALEIELFACIKRWVPFAQLIYKSTYCKVDYDQGLITAYINYVDIFHGLNRSFQMDLLK